MEYEAMATDMRGINYVVRMRNFCALLIQIAQLLHAFMHVVCVVVAAAEAGGR